MRELLIVDLEATCWERAVHVADRMETIEIGAVLVDPLRVVDPFRARPPREFQCFVRPVRSPELSAFCRRLTGIRQEEVDAAETFPHAFARFCDWIGAPASVRFASWGNYDRVQLQRDCALHGVAYPFGSEHFNLKHHLSGRLGLKPAGLVQALQRGGLVLEGTHHRALDDARNIWRLLEHVDPGGTAEPHAGEGLGGSST